MSLAARAARWREYAEWLLVQVLRHLPVSWVSGVGALLGELEVRCAAARHKIWVQRFYRNVAALCGAATPAAQRACLHRYGRQVGRVYAEFAVLHKLARQGHIGFRGLENLGEQTRPSFSWYRIWPTGRWRHTSLPTC